MYNLCFLLGLAIFLFYCSIALVGFLFLCTKSKLAGLVYWGWVHNFIAHPLLCLPFDFPIKFHDFTAKRWEELANE